MTGWIVYFILFVTIVAAIIIRRDTKELIRRSDEIQKSLNKFICKERKQKCQSK